ncbi:Titan9, putative isoform 1 [Cinnamomum micranthum f. kanehirae]|uniref:Titan9, putative isoform 1 n=1 Tax=Cinnamomum micranthum f. kanehirae TaxID=337451 RepID=A0A443NC64_9MAGN|nr:Titan9, putative isoform 1 [Cinnamomum micranthum f. kanehirae]
MESLYTKLYDKYKQLKARKDSEMDKISREQEEKFLNYVSAAEEHIEHLKNVNNGLQEKIDELTNQIVLDRSSENSQYSMYQNLFIEEKQKTKELLEEVERLRSLLSERVQCSNNNENCADRQLKSPSRCQVNLTDLSKGSARRMTLKPSSGDQTEEAGVNPDASCQEVHIIDREPEGVPIKGTPSNGAPEKLRLIYSCGTDMETSGSGSGICHTNCIFQTLVECLVGMKFSIVNHTEELCLSILHQSSGYTFSLTWVKNAAGQDELLYHVLSLGTFERVAPEWMREDLMFSMSMCPFFFLRITEITRLHS